MGFAENDDVIEALLADRADQPLRIRCWSANEATAISTAPRRAWPGEFLTKQDREVKLFMTTDSQPPSESMPHLVAALAQSLKAIDGDYREEMREMRELFEEAKKEAEKVEPSGVKLKAILTDCNEIVRTFAALDPAWQGVQRVARMFGFL